MNHPIRLGALLIAGGLVIDFAPTALAAETVTYEVTSRDISVVNLEFADSGRRQAQANIPLPWRLDVSVQDPLSNDAEVRADWRPLARPAKWVTVRIYYRGKLVCDNTLDVGNAACYGSTTFK